MVEALPLAEQPHLLQYDARRADLFGLLAISTRPDSNSWEDVPHDLALSAHQTQGSAHNRRSSSACKHRFDNQISSVHQLENRWFETIGMFARIFAQDVGQDKDSYIGKLVDFPIKEVQFRQKMLHLRASRAQRDLVFGNMSWDREEMIVQTFKELDKFYILLRQLSSQQQPLTVNRVKVTFKDDLAQGSGVARSFYTALAEAILSQEDLPDFNPPKNTTVSRL